MTRTCHRFLAFLVSLGILSQSNPASAGEMPSVGVVGVHRAELDAAGQRRVVGALAEAIERTGRAEALTPAEVARTVQGREEVVLSDGLLGPGRRLLDDGRHLYNQAQPEEAIPVLRRAIASLELGQAAATDVRDLWEAWMYLGTSLLAVERAEEADVAFRSAAALIPARSPNPGLFPPPVVEAWTAARDALRAQAVTLRIEAPGDARLVLDGVEVGRGSATVEGVLPGDHHLAARGDGVQAYERLTLFPPSGDGEGRVVDVRLTLGPPTLGRAAEGAAARSRQTGALYRALGDHARNVDLLLLAGTTDDVLHLQLYSPPTDSFGQAVDVPIDGELVDAAARGVPLLFEAVGPDGALAVGHTSPLALPLDVGSNVALATLLVHPRPTPSPDRPKVARSGPRVLPLLLGAAGVAAIGTGAYFGVSAVTGVTGPRHDGTIRVGPFG